MNKPNVSVVVTVYNKKNYIEKCLESILNQSFENIEVICVDDGSTDSSLEILERFADTDKRIKIYHQDNMGLVMARKNGLSHANAEWAAFVDADDWIDPEMYETMYRYAVKNDLELVTCGMVHKNGKSFDYVDEGIYSIENNNLRYLFEHMVWVDETRRGGVMPHTVNKLFKTDKLRSTSRNIDSRIRYGEDNALVYSYSVKCKRIGVLHKSLYHVRYVEDSHSKVEDEWFFARMNMVYLFLKDVFENSEYKESLMKQLDYSVVHYYILGINKFMGTGVELHINPRYPLNQVRGKCRILIYGAGSYGKQIRRSIEHSNEKDNAISILGYIDKNKCGEENGLNIYHLEQIHSFDFDYVVIAIKNKSESTKIREELLSVGVSEEKIIDEMPLYSL